MLEVEGQVTICKGNFYEGVCTECISPGSVWCLGNTRVFWLVAHIHGIVRVVRTTQFMDQTFITPDR